VLSERNTKMPEESTPKGPESAIVLVTSSFPMSGDGSEAAGSFVLDLANEIALQYSCRVVAPGPETCLEESGTNLKVFRFQAPERPLSTLKPWVPRDLTQIFKVLRAGQAATIKAVNAGSTKMIVALWALPSGHWARQAAKARKIPYRVWTLGSDIWSLGRIPLLRRHIAKILRDADSNYADGIQLAAETSKISGRATSFLPSSRAIDASKARISRTEPPYRFLYLGRWHRNKGVDLLLDALQQLSDSDWTRIESFSIFGGGPLDKIVQDSVSNLEKSNRPVLLGGYLEKPEAEQQIADADWLVIPSRIESIPLIFSDAMKLSTPVIAMPVGDLPELLSGNGPGLRADSATSQALARSIIAATQSQASRYSDRARAAALEFDLASVCRKLLSTNRDRSSNT